MNVVRKKCIKETFTPILNEEQVNVLASQEPNMNELKKHIAKGTVYLLKDEQDSLEGYTVKEIYTS